ncbi:hypothetical protein MKX08_009170 [Trichoderma sp. CBMAI-0020]|nr:hypothetical protein MKX08_009170 [Trichoderma sp. CBMAI-0020]
MVRSLRRGLLTAAAVWAASAVAGSEQDSHEGDSKWLASIVTVTSTAYVDLKDYQHRCTQGHYACAPTTTAFPEQKNCKECQKGKEADPGSWNTAAGAYNKDPASYNKDSGSYNKDSGSYNKSPGTYNTATGTWDKDPSSEHKDSGAWNKVPENSDNHGSKDSGSWSKDSGSWNKETGTWEHGSDSESSSGSWSKDSSAWNHTWGNWHTDPTDVYHGLWGGCGATAQHCPSECSCSSKSICENPKGPQCKSSTECKPGEMCNSNGVCQPIPGPRCQGKACEADNGGKCTTNKDCEHGQICNQRGYCQKVVFPDCEKNSDCKWGQICTSWGICKTADTPACQNDKGCNDDHVCNSQRICQKAECPKCKWDTECKGGEGCFDGSCKSKENNKCHDNRQCEDGEICDSEGRCRRGDHFHCKVDSECKFDQVCDIHGLCQKRAIGVCGSDRQCQDSEFCNAFGHCEKKPFDRCERNTQCLPGEICSNHRCVPKLGCSTQGDCRRGERCERNICVKTRDCRHDFECLQGDQCLNGRCERRADTCSRDQELCSDGKVCFNRSCVECSPDVVVIGKRAPAAIHNCPSGYDCRLGRCVQSTQAECSIRRPCFGDQICNNGTCADPECTATITCGNGRACKNGRCVAPECSALNPCDAGETCRGRICYTQCTSSLGCSARETCEGGICLRKRFCNLQNPCPGTELCTDGFCQQPETCTNGQLCNETATCANGLQWAYYKLTRAVRDTVTLAGTIPFRTADPETAVNWPILHFQPNVALQLQIPRDTGFTQTLGIQRTCPPENAIVYGTNTGTSIDYSIIQHVGYFRPSTAGTYTFQVAPGLRQTVYVWLGANAIAGWTNLNANLIADGSSTVGLNTWLRVVSENEVGRYIPIRVLYANAQDCGEFDLSIIGPNNAVLVSRETSSTDGQLLSNCAASALLPSLGFEPILDVGIAGVADDNLEIGIGSNLGSLGISAGVNVADTGNVGQALRNGTLLNVTAGGNGVGVGNGGNGNLLNVTAGGNGVGVGLNGSALGLGGLNLTLPVPLP